MLRGPSEARLYSLPSPIKTAFFSASVSFQDWHARLGHPHSSIMSSIISKNKLDCSSSHSLSLCSACKLGKLARMSLALVEHTSQYPFDIVHSDVWGPAPILSNLGFSYFILFVDDFTHFTWNYFLKNKSQVITIFKEFESLVFHQFNCKIKAFHSDWGGEYKKLNSYFKQT